MWIPPQGKPKLCRKGTFQMWKLQMYLARQKLCCWTWYQKHKDFLLSKLRRLGQNQGKCFEWGLDIVWWRRKFEDGCLRERNMENKLTWTKSVTLMVENPTAPHFPVLHSWRVLQWLLSFSSNIVKHVIVTEICAYE